MRIILLDAGGAGLAYAALAIFMIIAVVTEAVVMMIMRYNNAGKSFLDSFVANVTSLVAGYLLFAATGSGFYIVDSVIFNFLLLLVITVAVEFAVLYFMNRGRPANKTFLVATVMNVATYIILYFFVEGI
jgi:hypothetical protein